MKDKKSTELYGLAAFILFAIFIWGFTAGKLDRNKAAVQQQIEVKK